jgi:class 3 adenylate cyclase
VEPRIQYAQTSDGVSIAFATVGDGMPLVEMSGAPFSHIQLEWQKPRERAWHEGLAEKRRLIVYDARGLGMSQRGAADFSLDAQMLDLEAVVDRLGLDKFALIGHGNCSPAAIAYAGRYPERVPHLILLNAYARASDWGRSPQLRALSALVHRDWETYTETYANIIWGWSAGEEARSWARALRASITQEAMQLCARTVREFDVTELLPLVRSPTLVLHRRDWHLIGVDTATELASKIPDARLVLMEGAHASDWDRDTAIRAIDEFLGPRKPAKQKKRKAATPSGVATILFTDMEGSTALTQRLGDARAREVMREHERMVREALRSHGGSELKTMGDGFMASFSSATRALESAIAMQRAFAAHNESAEEPILVRAGLNAGEPIAEEEDLFGTAVIRAARIAAEAKGGEILVANVVRELAEGKQFVFADRGEVALKGFDEPVRLYEVKWRE